MTTLQRFDVIVIGGGTVGTAAAWALARRDVRALVLEQFHHVHPFGAHGGSTRSLRPHTAIGSAYAGLMQRSVLLWDELQRETGEPVLTTTGSLELRPGPPGATDQIITDLAHRYPAVAIPDGWDVEVRPDSKVISIESALKGMARLAAQSGIEFHVNEAVLSWSTGPSGIEVVTGSGSYWANRLVLAAGAWTSELLPGLELPLLVMRRTMLWTTPSRPDLHSPDRFPLVVVDAGQGEVLIYPQADEAGLKIVDHAGGSPAEPRRRNKPSSLSDSDLVATAKTLIPSLAGTIRARSVCLFVSAPDGDFIIDRHPTERGVVIGAGFSGHGFAYAPAIGEQLAELALDDRAAPPADFSITRFGFRSSAQPDSGERPE